MGLPVQLQRYLCSVIKVSKSSCDALVWLRGPASRLTVVCDRSALELSFLNNKCHLHGSVYLFLLLKLESLYLKVTLAKLLSREVPSPFAQKRGCYGLVGCSYSSQHQHYLFFFTFLIVLMLPSPSVDIPKALAALQYGTVSSKR